MKFSRLICSRYGLEVHVDAELDLEERGRSLHAREAAAQVAGDDVRRQQLEEEPLRVAGRDDGVGGEAPAVGGLDPARAAVLDDDPRHLGAGLDRPAELLEHLARASASLPKPPFGIHIVRNAWTKKTPAITADSSAGAAAIPTQSIEK